MRRNIAISVRRLEINAAAGQPTHIVRTWVVDGLMPEPRRAGDGHKQGTRNLIRRQLDR